MKKIIPVLLSLLFAVPSAAASNKEIQTLLAQSAQPLRAELSKAFYLPADLIPGGTDYRFTLSRKKTGALAQYRASSSAIYIFKKPLAGWIKSLPQNHTPQQLASMFARCAAPLYIHELSHGRDQNRAAENGFVWPLTLEDEYAAYFWQLYFIRKNLEQDPLYYQNCGAFMPPEKWLREPPEKWEHLIYARYVRFNGKQPPPPPLRRPYREEMAADARVTFEGKTFKSNARFLTNERLFKNGGNWLRLKPKELKQLPSNPLFLKYLQLADERRAEISRHIPTK